LVWKKIQKVKWKQEVKSIRLKVDITIWSSHEIT
jgi:hypothetical protein